MPDDIGHLIGDGFDAVLCMGNSFAELLDTDGDQRDQKLALQHFVRCLKPGGLLLIDHRNYDSIIGTGKWPIKNIYYNVSGSHMLLSVLEMKNKTRTFLIWNLAER